MDKKLAYRYCIVPLCTNTTSSTPDKYFFHVPNDKKVRNKWCKLMKREPLSTKTSRHCCEDHFNVDKPKIKHDWYQTESQVVITILIKNAPADKVKVHYSDKNLSVTSTIPQSDSEYSLEIELAHEIIPTMCTHVVTPSKIEVKLRKKEGLRWNSLEGESNEVMVKAIPQAVIDASGPQRPPPIFKKDWDKIEQDLKKEEEKEKPEGDAALNALFQKIYGEGSDEVRRAMNKSYMESGGTVLSTNWNQVAKEKVEVKPPDGVEFRKWDN